MRYRLSKFGLTLIGDRGVQQILESRLDEIGGGIGIGCGAGSGGVLPEKPEKNVEIKKADISSLAITIDREDSINDSLSDDSRLIKSLSPTVSSKYLLVWLVRFM